MEEQIADGQFSILIVIFAEKLKISNNAFFYLGINVLKRCVSSLDYLPCLGLKLIFYHGKKFIYTQTQTHMVSTEHVTACFQWKVTILYENYSKCLYLIF